MMTPQEIETLVDFEQQIQWRWSSGDPTAYMDALAEDVIYVDPLAQHFLVGREAVRQHFKRIHSGDDTGIVRQAYHNQICRVLSENEVLLTFGFTTYKQDENGQEEIFLSWNMSLIFRKTDSKWLMTHGHLSLRHAFDPDSIPKLREMWAHDDL
ncbi:YybH family protein [Neisseria sp. CCUG17229]|uniref:YybH family protein n=1 Tax=Neisseria sp. CCUG17229 TaxID=3392036 RepID=UPI003A0FD5BB